MGDAMFYPIITLLPSQKIDFIMVRERKNFLQHSTFDLNLEPILIPRFSPNFPQYFRRILTHSHDFLIFSITIPRGENNENERC